MIRPSIAAHSGLVYFTMSIGLIGLAVVMVYCSGRPGPTQPRTAVTVTSPEPTRGCAACGCGRPNEKGSTQR